MASPSSFSARNYKFNVFASFHGPDVRRTLLSHMREQFNRNGITMFDDQKIVRSATIAPSLIEAIRDSRISIVILSKKYASSSWCLDELLEILKCRNTMKQIVMTIFYGVVPSDVRKQTGKFGIAFNGTCEFKTVEERQKWSNALNDVATIAGEDFLAWDNEAKMIEKIARDVSDKLNATPSRDFDGMVGIEDHLKKMESLLDLDNDGVKMVAITGPAGIGKTTIARALHSRLSHRFQLNCFVDNLRGSYYNGLDELHLQEQFLSKILNHNGLRISHSGVIEERLCEQRVLIILDDVNNIKQLEALANETSWFGPGSRIVVTTENKELLQQHDINNIYHVGFPSSRHALEILCRYAFKQSYPHNGYEMLANEVTELCGNLPLGLRVVGSSLRGKNEEEWMDVICRLGTNLDKDIEEVLRVGYESLDEDEKTLFIHIVTFFNNSEGNRVKAMLADNKLDIEYGLKILANRSLIHVSARGEIVIHKLLQQVGTKAIQRAEPWNRQILIDSSEIRDVLQYATGTQRVSGISFDISDIDEISVDNRAFERMSHLRFLKIYKSKWYSNDDIDEIFVDNRAFERMSHLRFLKFCKSKWYSNDVVHMHIPETMEFSRRLRLLDWETYPNKCLPPTFHPEYLVELDMQDSQLEYLWQGTQKLGNLKKMDLSRSYHLKELPDLSNATNLEILVLSFCRSLVEIPSSFSHLQKLWHLDMHGCRSLKVVPGHLNLASLLVVYMEGCPLETIPFLSTRITTLHMSEASSVEEVPASIRLCSRLKAFVLRDCGNLKRLTHLPTSLGSLDLSNSDIERIPDCIKALHQLYSLDLSGCRRLTSLPELPASLSYLVVDDCESLEKVFYPLSSSLASLYFTNCSKLDQQARKSIIQRCLSIAKSTLLPGRRVPEEFDYRARGNALTISLDGKYHGKYHTVRLCVVVSPNHQTTKESSEFLMCRYTLNGNLDKLHSDERYIWGTSKCRTDHLYIFEETIDIDSREIQFEFSSENHGFDVIECGAHILTYDTSQGICSEFEPSEDDTKICVAKDFLSNDFFH